MHSNILQTLTHKVNANMITVQEVVSSQVTYLIKTNSGKNRSRSLTNAETIVYAKHNILHYKQFSS